MVQKKSSLGGETDFNGVSVHVYTDPFRLKTLLLCYVTCSPRVTECAHSLFRPFLHLMSKSSSNWVVSFVIGTFPVSEWVAELQ